MAYSKFTLADALKRFDLTLAERTKLFPAVAPVAPGTLLRATLDELGLLALDINSEKARSEFIIAPILAELRRYSAPVSLFSGVNFDVDAEKGLSGYCDYLLTRSTQQLFIEAPVLAIFEAKNEDIKSGLGQCLSAMVAAQIFNERDAFRTPVLYGAVTTGTNWRFLKLEGTTVTIDSDEESWQPIERLLGILKAIVAPVTA